MPTEPPSLLSFYAGWNGTQRQLNAMVAQLSSEQLALPTDSHHWPIGSVVQHLVGNRVWWFHLWMDQGSDEIARLAHWDPADPAHEAVTDPAELLVGLDSSWQIVADALRQWTAGDLATIIDPPASLSAEEQATFGSLSRQWIIWHVIEHEILHAGELSLALGSYGLKSFYGNF